ncbi:hypothetical protein EKD04_017965 [Chloroflexales bacterium ZM16-3]|nr:hypothetical protein [Chloroflexales bacterium ZM16-3]
MTRPATTNPTDTPTSRLRDLFFGSTQRALLHALAVADAPRSTQELAQAVGRHRNTIDTLLVRMVVDGLVVTESLPNGGRRYALGDITDALLLRRLPSGFAALLEALWRDGGGTPTDIYATMRQLRSGSPVSRNNIVVTLQRMAIYGLVRLTRQGARYDATPLLDRAAVLRVAYDAMRPAQDDDAGES